MAHIHNIIDNNTPFAVVPLTRGIEGRGIKLIQGDHNSERITFEVPRFVDGHDMSECTKIEVHYCNLATDKKGLSADVYPVTDVALDDTTESTLTFSWLISGNATRYEGTLSFLIKFTCLTGKTVDYAWHTDIFSGITVGEGMDNGEAVVANYSDVLEAWKAEVMGSLSTPISVDAELSEESENPVQNKVITAEIAALKKLIESSTPGAEPEPVDLMTHAANLDFEAAGELMVNATKCVASACIPYNEAHQYVTEDLSEEFWGNLEFTVTSEVASGASTTNLKGKVLDLKVNGSCDGYFVLEARRRYGGTADFGVGIMGSTDDGYMNVSVYVNVWMTVLTPNGVKTWVGNLSSWGELPDCDNNINYVDIYN